MAFSPFFRKISSNKFIKNVALVALGTAGAQAITMLCSPFITRLYGPQAFGLLGTYIAILAVLSPIAALSYPIAIVLPKADSEAYSLIKISVCLSLMISAASLLIIWPLSEEIANIFSAGYIKDYLPLLPLAMLMSSLALIMNQWVIRSNLYKIGSKVAVLQSGWTNIAQISIGLLYPKPSVLISISTISSGIQAYILYKNVQRSGSTIPSIFSVKSVLSDSLKEVAWKYRDFAFYRTPQIFLNSASQSLPVIMLAALFGPASAGFYSLGKMVLGVPSTLVGQSVSAVFYPRINEAVQRSENAFKILMSTTFYLSAIGILPFGIVIAFGPWIFKTVFGVEWETAGIYAQWLATWSYFGFINRPSVAAIPVFSLQGYFLIYEIFSVIVRTLSLAYGYYYTSDALYSIKIFSLSSVFLNSILIIVTAYTVYKQNPGKLT